MLHAPAMSVVSKYFALGNDCNKATTCNGVGICFVNAAGNFMTTHLGVNMLNVALLAPKYVSWAPQVPYAKP